MKIPVYIAILFLIMSCSNDVSHSHPDAIPDGEDNDSAADEDTAVFQLKDLKAEMNANNSLSCRLTFKTDEPLKTIVRYSSKTHKGYEMSEDKAEKDHYFFLWGMRAQTTYTISVYSADDPETVIGSLDFTTGSLPVTAPYTFLSGSIKEKVLDGFVLYTFSATKEEKAQPLAMMVDTDGEVVWYFEYYQAGYSIFCDLQYIEKTNTILISIIKGFNMADIPAEEAIEIDLEGNIIWKAPAIANVYGDEQSWNHIYEKLPDDTILMLRHEWIGPVMTEKILNLDLDYNELWSWRYLDHFEPPACDLDSCEWTHSNTVYMYKDKGIVYVNSRNLSAYHKIDMATGDILWEFGRNGDFTMLSDHPDPWFEFAHDPEPSSADAETVLFYDNGSPERRRSRIIEYSLNQTDMTAEITFEYDGTYDGKKWFSEFWGDADRLPNGSIFVTTGLFDPEQNSRLFELTRDGDVVWELIMDRQNEFMITLYNAQKIPIEKLLERQ
ncbi:MAG TPA: aryl-sulfate sulfotransferase [bacterium]|nr:aryl-sulfate sulfotransferase [bacterium]